MAELHYLFACSQQVGAQPSSVTAGAFHSPGPSGSVRVAVSPDDELRGSLCGSSQTPPRRVHHRSSPSPPKRLPRPGLGRSRSHAQRCLLTRCVSLLHVVYQRTGRGTARQHCDESHHKRVDRLLIRSTTERLTGAGSEHRTDLKQDTVGQWGLESRCRRRHQPGTLPGHPVDTHRCGLTVLTRSQLRFPAYRRARMQDRIKRRLLWAVCRRPPTPSVLGSARLKTSTISTT